MASRPRGYGFTAEIKHKINSKYDEGVELEARQWLDDLLGVRLTESSGAVGPDKMHEILKDGKYLCQAINVLSPGSVKINESKLPFMKMENICKFLKAAEEYGCSRVDLFQTVDLYEKQNMVQVINGIMALGRMAQKNGFNGPTCGPKESKANRRDFTEEQLKAGNTVIGLQAGSNKGASQAGMNLGKTRAILD